MGCGQIAVAMTMMAIAAVVMRVLVVGTVPDVFAELGQPAIVVGMDMRAIAAGMLVDQQGGAGIRDVECEQRDDGGGEPSAGDPTAMPAFSIARMACQGKYGGTIGR